MKLNLSVDGEDFKGKVEILRKKLDECLISGVLDDSFEDELRQLLQMEKMLLTDLIPYYRIHANNSNKTSMQVSLVKELGAIGFNGFLKSALKINENIFITCSTGARTQFLNINTLDGTSHSNQIKAQWSPNIEEIKETIFFTCKLNDKEILLLGVKGGCYLLASDNFDQMPNIKQQIKVKMIETKGLVNGLSKCLQINKGLFVAENKNEGLNLLEIIKEKNEYSLILHENIYCGVPNITALEKVSKNYFVAGTRTGKLFFVKYKHKQLMVTEEIDFLDDEIRQIKCLEDENGNKNSLIVVGNNGCLRVFSPNGDVKTAKLVSNNFKGNLFDVQSLKGIAVVLSEDGIIYLLEENFGNWYLNDDATIKDSFFTNIIKLDIAKYLLIDVEGKLNLLVIDRINTPEDLWNLQLYQ